METIARLEVALLGALAITRDGQALTGFGYDKVRALLIRERLHGQVLPALAALMDYHEGRGEDAAARRYAWQALTLEVWDEAAHRCPMRVFARAGKRVEALAQYERCRRILADELGIEPAAEARRRSSITSAAWRCTSPTSTWRSAPSARASRSTKNSTTHRGWRPPWRAAGALSAYGATGPRGALLLGAAYAARDTIGAPMIAPDRLDYERWLASFRAHLGDNAFAAAWARGQGLTLAQALGAAAAELPHAARVRGRVA